MGLIKIFMPNDYVKSVFQIDIEKLAEAGFKGIITDLDNTLVGWDVKSPTIEIQQWFKRANELGITITIVSNNNEDRVSSFSKDHRCGFYFQSKKTCGQSI